MALLGEECHWGRMLRFPKIRPSQFDLCFPFKSKDVSPQLLLQLLCLPAVMVMDSYPLGQ